MIFWLASYPKSGNTWVRSIICSLLYTKNGAFNFNDLEKIKQFPLKIHFKNLTDNSWNINEIAKNWVLAQERLNLDNEIKFFKTHNAFCKYKNFSFTNKENTLATIYIVRDPRNVITSLSNHYSLSIEKSKKMLFSSQQVLGNEKSNKNINDVYTVLGSWSDHYNSWMKLDRANTLIVKYEDLIKDPKSKILEIAKFLNNYVTINISDKKIEEVSISTDFEVLKKYEKKNGFSESVQDNEANETPFFYLGKKNNWKNILDLETIKEIEQKFLKEMTELKYIA